MVAIVRSDGSIWAQEPLKPGTRLVPEHDSELRRQLENERARGIHSCGPKCNFSGCVNRRLREQLELVTGALELGLQIGDQFSRGFIAQFHDKARAALTAEIEAAKAEEREACAQVCESMHEEDGPNAYAYAIRARSKA
ncbi:hypothetical protein [Uliginosibacterium sp. 31-12]|uniref:hypothetical protein n=1 Tax=Uliginosibacterium sp. 31-12 TaxID=3062781 RepID=UPI0026E2D596|nr:hypothetical protein [Uliginosibacterium sp. 31-12]MDO6385624.1 hypothetical protein [Uliginosibacterium sp. 31-12]